MVEEVRTELSAAQAAAHQQLNSENAIVKHIDGALELLDRIGQEIPAAEGTCSPGEASETSDNFQQEEGLESKTPGRKRSKRFLPSGDDLIPFTTKKEEILNERIIPSNEFVGVDFVFDDGRFYGKKSPPMELFSKYVKFLRKLMRLPKVFDESQVRSEIGPIILNKTKKIALYGELDRAIHSDIYVFSYLQAFLDSLKRYYYEASEFIPAPEFHRPIRTFESTPKDKQDADEKFRDKQIYSVKIIPCKTFTQLLDVTRPQTGANLFAFEVNFTDGSFCDNWFGAPVLDFVLGCYDQSIQRMRLSKCTSNTNENIVFYDGKVWISSFRVQDRPNSSSSLRWHSEVIFKNIAKLVYEVDFNH
jgi:hypothetical protein